MEATHEDSMKELKAFMEEAKTKERPSSHLISILHKTQKLWGFVPREAMDEISVTMNIPTAHIWGVATFYHFFNLTPRGKHTISVCMGTACYVKGADRILDQIKETLDIEEGETTEDNLFTLQETRCLGACGLAPVIMVDDKIYGDLTPKKVVKLLNTLKEQSKEEASA